MRPSIWESVLQTRAVENKFFAVCTLHRNSRPKKGEGRPQKEPYAFSERGKIRLRDLETDSYIDSIPEKARTGKIYLLDTSYYETIPANLKSAGELARKARTITVLLGKKRQILVRDKEHNYHVKRIGIEEFLLSPENLWRIVLEEREKTTLFVVLLRNRMQWETYRERVSKIIKGRVTEFSTLFLFTDNDYSEIFMAAYRSSNYKESRIFYPKRFPVNLDERYLMGMESTFDISLGDPRCSDEELYFERVNKLIDLIQE